MNKKRREYMQETDNIPMHKENPYYRGEEENLEELWEHHRELSQQEESF
jgi:hypothetical protein